LGAGDAAADYDVIKNGPPGLIGTGNFARFALAADPRLDTLNPPLLTQKTFNAKRSTVRNVLFGHNLVGNPNGGSSSSGCSEVAGDDGVVSLGSFVMTTVNNVSHGRGTTDQQAGTFMHEFGHLLGLQHGGDDNVNCKPNYRSVMSYPRQFAGSPIPSRRLDYSRSVDPLIATNNGFLNESSLNEFNGLGIDPSLGPIPGRNPGDVPFFPSADQIVFGPGAWSLVPSASTTNSAPLWPLPAANTPVPINWDRSIKGQGPSFQSSTSADISGGATSGCDTSGALTSLAGFNDWNNLLYRLSAAIDFAGGAARSETPLSPGAVTELTKEDETNLFLGGDVDGNGVGDGQDCGAAQTQTTAPLSPTSTTIQIAGNPTTLGFATPSGGAFLVAPGSPRRDDITYTGTTDTGLTGVSGVSFTWPSGTTVVGLCPLHQCGTLIDGSPFLCSTHRIDIKPSFALPKVINLGTEANVTIAIFSETNWNAPAEIMVDAASLAAHPLTFTVENVVENVKTNNNGSGTCSISDVADPITGQKDGIKDLKCQFPTSGLPPGTHYGVVNGFFLDPATNQFRAFSARQEVTILP